MNVNLLLPLYINIEYKYMYGERNTSFIEWVIFWSHNYQQMENCQKHQKSNQNPTMQMRCNFL